MPQAKGVLPAESPMRGARARHLATVRPRNRVTTRSYRLPPADGVNRGQGCKPQTPANLVFGSHGSETSRSRPPYCFMAKKDPFYLGDGRHTTGKTVIGANAATTRTSGHFNTRWRRIGERGGVLAKGGRFGARRAGEKRPTRENQHWRGFGATLPPETVTSADVLAVRSQGCEPRSHP